MIKSTFILLSSEPALPSDLKNLHIPYQQPSDWHLFHVENVQSPYSLPSKPLGMVFSHTIISKILYARQNNLDHKLITLFTLLLIQINRKYNYNIISMFFCKSKLIENTSNIFTTYITYENYKQHVLV